MRGRLVVSPGLPGWLPELELRNLCVGDAAADLDVRGDAVEARVVRGRLEVVPRTDPTFRQEAAEEHRKTTEGSEREERTWQSSSPTTS